MKIDAQNAVKVCLSKNIRPGCQHPPAIGAAIDVGIDGSWAPGWRMVGMIASNVVAEHDGQFRKFPLAQVRSSDRQMLLPPANDTGENVDLPVCLVFNESQRTIEPRGDENEDAIQKLSVSGGFDSIDLCWAVLGFDMTTTKYEWWFQEHNRDFPPTQTGCSMDELFAGNERFLMNNVFSADCPEEDFDPIRLHPKTVFGRPYLRPGDYFGNSRPSRCRCVWIVSAVGGKSHGKAVSR